MKVRSIGSVVFTVSLGISSGASLLQGQNPKAQPEFSTSEEPATFKARTDLVMVPVVVRDAKGQAVGSLVKEDFQLFDKGRPQIIARFSIEQPGTRTIEVKDVSAKAPGAVSIYQPTVAGIATRFVAYVFDDIHADSIDLMRTRNAAMRHLSESLAPSDRAAIYTTSGRVMLDFTDDHAKLNETLLRLMPSPIAGSDSQECPDISYYQADLIINKEQSYLAISPNTTVLDLTNMGGRSDGLKAAVDEALHCLNVDSTSVPAQQIAINRAITQARKVLGDGEHQSRIAILLLRDVVRKLSSTPGQRTLLLASPGFLLTINSRQDETDLMERAIQAKVVINSLDARGMYTNVADVSKHEDATAIDAIHKAEWGREAQMEQANVLGELADATGGRFFQNRNDLETGFKELAAAPEYIYMLGFSPQNLKSDGSFHALKVSLARPSGLSLSARRGYYAPSKAADAAESARREIEEAMFSQDEVRELPIDFRTEYFKTSDTSANLSVLAHLDLRRFQFKKGGGINSDDLTMVTGLFDRNGNYIKGTQKKIIMRFQDATLDKLGAGATVTTVFTVAPGTYVVRLVVRDADGQSISAENGAVVIP
jgi:VWFA-related protein